MKNLALIGCGAIGLRHLQSLLNINVSDLTIYVIETNNENTNKAKKTLANSHPIISPHVHWNSKIGDLPTFLNFVVIATNSSNRLEVLLSLLKNRTVECLILEKILFNKIEDYDIAKNLLKDKITKCYVNFSLRLWPVFQKIKSLVNFSKIDFVEVLSPGEDIGCNGIHFIDLMSFWTETENFNLYNFEITNAAPAKRSGYLDIKGKWKGQFKSKFGKHELLLNFQSGKFEGINIFFYSKGKKVLNLKWSNNEVEISGKLEKKFPKKNWDLIFQSKLTEKYYESFSQKREIGLPTFNESINNHIMFLKSIIEALPKIDVKISNNICPIT